MPTTNNVILIKVKRLRRTMSHQERPLESGNAFPPSLARRADASTSLSPTGGGMFCSAGAPLGDANVCAMPISGDRGATAQMNSLQLFEIYGMLARRALRRILMALAACNRTGECAIAD